MLKSFLPVPFVVSALFAALPPVPAFAQIPIGPVTDGGESANVQPAADCGCATDLAAHVLQGSFEQPRRTCESVVHTVMVPKEFTEMWTVNFVEYQNQIRTRNVSKRVLVQEQRKRTATVLKTVQRSKEQQYTVLVPTKKSREEAYTVMVPAQETRTRMKTVCRSVVEPREQPYTVSKQRLGMLTVPKTVMKPQAKTNSSSLAKTVNVTRQVAVRVPEEYTVTVMKPETRTRTVNFTSYTQEKRIRTVNYTELVPEQKEEPYTCTTYKTIIEQVPYTVKVPVCIQKLVPATVTRMVAQAVMEQAPVEARRSDYKPCNDGVVTIGASDWHDLSELVPYVEMRIQH